MIYKHKDMISEYMQIMALVKGNISKGVTLSQDMHQALL